MIFSSSNLRFLRIAFTISLGWLLAASTSGQQSQICPGNCSCDYRESLTSLTIDCQQRRENSSNDSLFVEINELLLRMNNLIRLNITNTRLTSLPMEVCNQMLLHTLHIDHNQLQSLPDNCLTRLRSLEEFTADYNYIVNLQDGLFDGLLHLKKISLNFNLIKSIGQHLFTNVTDLLNLHTIQLNHNLLTELEPWPFIRAIPVPRVSVEITNNSIVRFTNNIEWYSNCQEGQHFISYRKMEMTLNLSYNRIEHISDLIREFKFESSLNVLCWLLQCELLIFSGNFICDCLDFEYFKMARQISHISLLNNVFCANSVIGLQSQRATEVPLDKLICEISDDCPSKCQCVSQPSNSTFHVNCMNTQLTVLPSIIPSSDLRHHLLLPKVIQSYQLDFSNNNISSLEPRPFLLNTFSLDLSNSHLKNITYNGWLQLGHVRRIFLHNNQLTVIPRVVHISNFSFDVLSIYNNRFSCDCDQLWLKTWLKSVYDRLENPLSIQCYSPLRLRGRSIFTVKDTEFCHEPKSENTLSVTTLCIVIILSILAAIIILSKTFRVKIFSTIGVHPFDRDECEGEEMDYDVFISYAHEDSNKAKEILVFLEMNSYKVCFHERDFLPGRLIVENILEAICKSKRVLCLASENFLASDYCMEEFHMAQFHSIKLKRTRVIMMMFSQFQLKISTTAKQIQQDEQQTSLLLQESANSSTIIDRFMSINNYIKSHTYIDSESNTWKNQLLYAMPIQRLLGSKIREGMPPETSTRLHDDDDDDDDTLLIDTEPDWK